MKTTIAFIALTALAIGCNRSDNPSAENFMGGVTQGNPHNNGHHSLNNPKSGHILGNPSTTISNSAPGVVNDTIFVTLTAAGNDVDIFPYFKGSSGNPKVSIVDNGT